MSGLSDRMIAVAGMVTPGKVLADIGCDHAYTAIYMVEKGLAQRVIAMDIGAGPIDIAKKNINASGLSDKITTRLSDGFEALSVGETEGAVIAGMGGNLIIRILEKGAGIIVPGYELVLSPQSDIGLVRKYLRQNGYIIKKEIIIFDHKKMYNIMQVLYQGTVSAKNETPDHYEGMEDSDNSDIEEIYDEYGEYLLKHPTREYKEYIFKEIEKKKMLISRLLECGGENASERLEIIKKELGKAEKAGSLLMRG